MSYLKMIMTLISVVQWFITKAVEAKAFKKGEEAQVAKSLLLTTELVSDVETIREWVKQQSPDVIDGILSDYYTRS
jgi:sensor histidine kinase regulating citrate/malate metabolism